MSMPQTGPDVQEAVLFVLPFPPIYQHLDRLDGYRRVVLYDDECPFPLGSFSELFDECIRVESIHDVAATEASVAGLAARHPIRAIYATFETAMEIAGILRERFGVDGMTAAEAGRVRDKHLMKTLAAEAGVAVPAIENVDSLEQVARFGERHGYPLIIKPRNGMGTFLTARVDSAEQLAKLEPLLFGESRPRGFVDYDLFTKGRFVVERYVSGDEYHCDSIVSDGEVCFASVARYLHPCIDTVEGALPDCDIAFPACSHDDSPVREILHMNREVVEALGIRNAVCHLEAFVEPDGTVLFGEIAARIGGGSLIGKCVANTHGVDIFEAFIDVELGGFQLPDANTRDVYTGYGAFATRRGVVRSVAAEHEFTNVPGMIDIAVEVKAGDHTSDRSSTIENSGFIMVEGTTFAEVADALTEACSRFERELVVE